MSIGYLSKRILRGKHGEYKGRTVYTPGEIAMEYRRQQVVNDKLLDLLAKMIINDNRKHGTPGEYCQFYLLHSKYGYQAIIK